MGGRLITGSIAGTAAVVLFGLIYYFSRLLAIVVERLYVTGQGILGVSLLDLGAATPTSDVVANVLFFTIIVAILPLIVLFGLIGNLLASTMSGLYKEVADLKTQLNAAVNGVNDRLDTLQSISPPQD